MRPPSADDAATVCGECPAGQRVSCTATPVWRRPACHGLGAVRAHPIGLARGGVDIGDDVGQMRISDIPRRRRPATSLLVARGRPDGPGKSPRPETRTRQARGPAGSSFWEDVLPGEVGAGLSCGTATFPKGFTLSTRSLTAASYLRQMKLAIMQSPRGRTRKMVFAAPSRATTTPRLFRAITLDHSQGSSRGVSEEPHNGSPARFGHREG
jgi:hypothetical protein